MLWTIIFIRTIISGDYHGTRVWGWWRRTKKNIHRYSEKSRRSITRRTSRTRVVYFYGQQGNSNSKVIVWWVLAQRDREGEESGCGWMKHRNNNNNNQMWVSSILLEDKEWKSTLRTKPFPSGYSTGAAAATATNHEWLSHLHGNGFGIMSHYLFLITFCGSFCSLLNGFPQEEANCYCVRLTLCGTSDERLIKGKVSK